MYFLELITIGEHLIHKLKLLIEIYLTYSTLSSFSEVDWREAT